MLGIRKYHGISIDLWLGDIKQFVSDITVLETKECNEPNHTHVIALSKQHKSPCYLFNTSILQQSDEFFSYLSLSKEITLGRHLTIQIKKISHDQLLKNQVVNFFDNLKKFLNTTHSKTLLKRVTLVPDNLSDHDCIQEVLFQSIREL